MRVARCTTKVSGLSAARTRTSAINSAMRMRMPVNMFAPVACRRGMEGGLRRLPGFLHRLDLDAQGHVHLESIVLAGSEPEVFAVERGQRVGAAHLSLEHRVRDAFETVDLQLDRPRDPVQGQFADDLRRCAI